MKGRGCDKKKKNRTCYFIAEMLATGKKNCFIRKIWERNDLAIVRSCMQEHRDKERTILVWERRANLLPPNAGIKETICKLAGVTHTEFRDSDWKANASTKLSFIKILSDTKRERERRGGGKRRQTLWIMELFQVGKIIGVASRFYRSACQLRMFLIWILFQKRKLDLCNNGYIITVAQSVPKLAINILIINSL